MVAIREWIQAAPVDKGSVTAARLAEIEDTMECLLVRSECRCVEGYDAHGDYEIPYGGTRSWKRSSAEGPGFFYWAHSSICLTVSPCNWLDQAVMQQITSKLMVPLFFAFAAPTVWLILRLTQIGSRKIELMTEIDAEKRRMLNLLEATHGVLESGMKFQATLAAELVFFLLDMALDVLCLHNLEQTQQYDLAGLQGLVLVASLAKQTRLGLLKFGSAVKESFKKGYQTDLVVFILQEEKLLEAFLSVVLQSFALVNLLRFQEAVAWQFTFSILSGVFGICKATYRYVQLDLVNCLDSSSSHWFMAGAASFVDSTWYGRQQDTE